MKFNMLGNANRTGPVRLSDAYSSLVGGASQGVAASQKALYNAYNSLNSSKLNIAGGTVTGSIIARFANIDASKTNNNVSTTQWPTTSCIMDKDSRILTRLEGVIDPNGNISGYWYVRNYDTNGNQVTQKGIQMTMNKTGGFSYIVSDPDKFLSALGAGNLVVQQWFNVAPSTKTSGTKTNTVNVPSGYKLIVSQPVGDYISGNASVIVTDKSVTLSGTTATINYYLSNPNNVTSSLTYRGSILLIKSL